MLKKMLSLVAAIVMIACLCSCNSETSEVVENKGNDLNNEVVSEKNSDEEENVDVPSEISEKEKENNQSANSDIYTTDEFLEIIKNYVDITKYEDITSENSTGCFYSLKKDLRKDFDFDFSIKLDGNAEIVMPMAFKDFTSQGWELKNKKEGDTELKPGYSTGALCTYKDSVITVNCVNMKDKNATYSEGYIHRVLFDLYSSSDKFAEQLKTAPQFTVCGDINNNSDIEDIIKSLGEPTQINYFVISDTYSKIELQYQNSNAYDNLDFVLNQDGSKIVSVDYSSDVK